MAATGRLLLAGVGYSNLRDGSVGPVLAERLARRAWPAWVEVHDYSFGAIDAIHRLRDAGYGGALFFGALDRGDLPGTIRRYLWQGGQAAEVVQERVAEAAQAIISLENTLIVAGYFGALPAKTVVFEVEPADMQFGEDFTGEVRVAVQRLERMLEEEVLSLAPA